MDGVFAAMNTIRAKWWEIRLARIFGKETTCKDSGCAVTVHHWRGKIYITDCAFTRATQASE